MFDRKQFEGGRALLANLLCLFLLCLSILECMIQQGREGKEAGQWNGLFELCLQAGRREDRKWGHPKEPQGPFLAVYFVRLDLKITQAGSGCLSTGTYGVSNCDECRFLWLVTDRGVKATTLLL